MGYGIHITPANVRLLDEITSSTAFERYVRNIGRMSLWDRAMYKVELGMAGDPGVKLAVAERFGFSRRQAAAYLSARILLELPYNARTRAFRSWLAVVRTLSREYDEFREFLGGI